MFKSTYLEEYLRTAALEDVFMKRRKIKIYKEFQFYIKETGFSDKNKWKNLFLLHDWFPMKFVFTYNISLV